MNRLRAWFEKIAYAGLKPDQPAKSSSAGEQHLPEAIDRILSGQKGEDPLYLSNRTAAQRVRLALMIAIPAVLVAGLVAASVYFRKTETKKQLPQETNAQIAAKMVPELPKLTVQSNQELDVMDVSVLHGHLTGTLRNNTDRTLREVEVVFDLTNNQGSKIGAVACRMASMQPKGQAKCDLTVPQEDAWYALVRDIEAK